MSQSVNVSEFWLPPEFLTDDDILTEKNGSTMNGREFGFRTGVGSNDLFPYDFESLGFSSDFGSPVESLIGSTETESDEEDFIAGLTRQFAHSTLEDETTRSNHGFPSDNIKAWGLSRSPESTLCLQGKGCGFRQRNCQYRISSPAATWDMYRAAAEEVARIRMEETFGSIHGKGLMGQSQKLNNLPAVSDSPNLCNRLHSSHPSLSYQKLRATQFQRLRQLQMMKQRQQQLAQNRGRLNVNNNDSPIHALPPSAWPSLQQARQQPQQRTGSGMRAVFLGNPDSKRERAGTGVFLPRRVNSSTPNTNSETRKKPALSTVLLPERVVQALNLKLDEPEVHRHFQPCFDFNNDPSYMIRYDDNFPSQKRNVRAEHAVTSEPMLPQDWSY